MNWDLALSLQAFVFPGAGYFVIRKRLRGFLMVVATSYFLIMPLVRFTRTALTFSLPAPTQLHPSGIGAVSLAWAAHKELILWSLAGIVVLWVFGIVDVWRMKRNQSSEEAKMQRS